MVNEFFRLIRLSDVLYMPLYETGKCIVLLISLKRYKSKIRRLENWKIDHFKYSIFLAYVFT